jgi:hypothetical protein
MPEHLKKHLPFSFASCFLPVALVAAMAGAQTIKPAPADKPVPDKPVLVRKAKAAELATHQAPAGEKHPEMRLALTPEQERDSSAEAQATLRPLNLARAKLSGVNRLPIPEGRVMTTPRGNYRVSTSDGRTYSLRADGTLASFQSRVPNGQSWTSITIRDFATFRSNGSIVSLRSGGPNGLALHRGAHGERVITARRPDSSTLVSTGRHSGYLEQSIDRDGQSLIRRTYLSGNRTWSRTYSRFNGRLTGVPGNGPVRNRYLPRYAFTPAFYGWASEWKSPVRYRWTWVHARWYSYYSFYFAPSASYANGSFWLTDYILAQTLTDGYEMQQPEAGSAVDAGSDANGDANSTDPEQQSGDEAAFAPAATAISPEVKQEIAAEVHQQLVLNSADDANADATPAATPGELDKSDKLDKPDDLNESDKSDDPAQFMQVGRVFIVSAPVSASVETPNRQVTSTLADAEPCSLSPGDVLRLTGIAPVPALSSSTSQTSTQDDESTDPEIPLAGDLEVVSSQRGDCPAGVHVRLSTMALEGMVNDFQAQLDDGLHELYSQQGKNGLPAAPPTAEAQQPAAANPAPGADDLSAQLQSLQAQANRAEADVAQMVASAPTTPSQP